MTDQVLRGARVALIYSPGHLSVDFAGSLVRGIERAFFELGARVATLNTAFFRRSIEEFAANHLPDDPYPDDAPLTQGIIGFLNETWLDAPFDICFGLFHDIFMSEQLMETLRRRARRVINYPLNLLDQPHRFERCSRFCDVTFCSEEEAVGLLREQYGTDRVRYVPMAADPFIHRPIGSPRAPRLLFVGSIYADRQLLLERCAEQIDVSVLGPGYGVLSIAKGFAREALKTRRFDGLRYAPGAIRRALRAANVVVSDEEYVRLASEHGVSIGLSTVRHERSGRLLNKVRLREYEATMCGMCHIARRLPELERGFEDGREILLYDGEEQIPEILARVTRGDVDFRRVGSAARARAVRDHTWTVRLGAAFA